MSNVASHNICTWGPQDPCAGCGLRSKLGCRPDRGAFQFFMVSQIPSLSLSVFGLVLVGVVTGTWWPLILYGAAAVLLWGLGLETRILCTHCPFWAEDSKVLHCLALTGSPKLWRYRPGPLAQWEKTTFATFLAFLLLFPPAAEAYAIWTMAAATGASGATSLLGVVGVTLATVLTGAQFYYVLRTRYCARCVNFSCPLNRVPRLQVDAYLARNQVMRKAWEDSGYRLASATNAAARTD